METAMTALVLIAALFFSLSLALLAEELLFGGIFRVMSAALEKSANAATRNPDQD